jgi:hypothetical protein
VKKALVILAAVALVLTLAACQSKGNPNKIGNADVSDVNRPAIIDYKGSEFGMTPADWVQAYVENGVSGVEKMAKFKDKVCIVVEAEGKSKDGTMLALSNLQAPVQIAGMISTRVQQRFAGAQVGDKDMIETYMENVVKVAREATFSGFFMDGETWVFLQYFKPGKKKEPDYRIYRAYQLWTIDREILVKQIEAVMDGTDKGKPKTAEKQRAIDKVKEAFYEGF